MEEIIDKLKNVIVNEGERFVNCCSAEFFPELQGELGRFLSRLKEEYKSPIYVNVNIESFENCKDEEQEVEVLLGLINGELTAKCYENVDMQAISIGNALYKWSNKLESQALVVFHCFHDTYDEKEKNILRELRKTHRNMDDMSRYLKILIVSNSPVYRWHLYPESNLDERHVALFEF
jgi:hypothetical protein